MNFITFQRKKIAYQLEGKGTPVVFVHGFCEDRTIWDEFKPEIVAAGYCVFTLDLPGFGESEILENTSVEVMADVVNAVLVEAQLSKIVLIGHSLGGYVALAFAKKYAEKLLGLGLFHSHPYPDSEEKKKVAAKASKRCKPTA